MGPQEMSGGPVSRKQLGWLQGWGRWVGSAQVIQEGQGVMRPVLPEDVGATVFHFCGMLPSFFSLNPFRSFQFSFIKYSLFSSA